MSQNTFEEVCNKEFRRGMHLEIMCEFLRKKKNPTILEFGVNTGGSTQTFISLAKELNGKVFSVDIKDCSNVSNSENWKFLKSDDLKIDYVLENFSEIKESGADLIYIDSYHENHHVSKLLNLNIQKVEFPKRYGGNIRIYMSKNKLKKNRKLELLLRKEKKFISMFSK